MLGTTTSLLRPADSAIPGLAVGLAGRWSFERLISNGATMMGEAAFAPDSTGGLAYSESGMLQMQDGTELQFSRRYLYRFMAGGLQIFFVDSTPGRLFQAIELSWRGSVLVGDGFHDCPPDVYRSRYEFDLPSGFSIAHEVAGPRKSYTLETRFRR